MKLNLELEFAARTHPGTVRAKNEDSLAVLPEWGLAILADGMGGYNAGEVASGMATSILSRQVPPELEEWCGSVTSLGLRTLHQSLQLQIDLANSVIYQSSQSEPKYAYMGTTLVVALFQTEVVTVAHIGDSRLYRLRNGQLTQITRDHSLLQEQVDAGFFTAEEAKLSLNKNLLTRAMGVDPKVEAEIHDYWLHQGDLYLLCSDGLNDMVEDSDIRDTLQSSGDLEVVAERLVQQANDQGGRDNISVIVVRAGRAEGTS